ncbi:MAG: hypothetical protein ACI8X5_002323 [Planctomycetota bacterium]|jgi:hypothetical protein
MHQSRNFWPILALTVYLGLRGVILVSSFDQVSLPAFELSPMGVIAQVASTGWRGAPLVTYYDNCGGHLAVGLMAAPLFKVFGPSYMALKLVPLILGAIDLLLIWSIAHQLFGKRAAIVASFAFCLGAQTLVVYSLLVKGNHFEGISLQLLATWCWVRGYRSIASRSWWAAAALVAGASISFYFGSILWIALLALTHLMVRGRKVGSIEFGLGCLPFALGLVPAFLIQFFTGRPSTFLDRLAQIDGAGQRLIAMFTEHLPQAAGFSSVGAIDGELASALFLFLFLGAWGLLLFVHISRSKRAEPGGSRDLSRLKSFALFPFLAYLPLFTLSYALSSARFDYYAPPVEVGRYRYLVLHFALSSVLFGALAAWASEMRVFLLRFLGTTVAILPIALGAFFALAQVDWSFSHFGRGFYYAGYDYADAARPLLRDGRREKGTRILSWDFPRLLKELDGFEGVDRERVAFGLGREMARAQVFEGDKNRRPDFDLERILDPFPEELRPSLARGVGSTLMSEPRFRNGLKSTLERILSESPQYAGFVAEGLSSPERGILARVTKGLLSTSQKQSGRVPAKLHVPWRRGQGAVCGELLGRGFAADRKAVSEFLVRIPPAAREAFWAGTEQAWNRSPRNGEVFAAERGGLEVRELAK